MTGLLDRLAELADAADATGTGWYTPRTLHQFIDEDFEDTPDAAFIAECSPETVAALLRIARAAEPIAAELMRGADRDAADWSNGTSDWRAHLNAIEIAFVDALAFLGDTPT